MARKGSKKEATYKEFTFDGKEFKYSGRIYPDNAKQTAKYDIIPFSLCLNGVITIKGMKLWRSDKNSWITGPSYQSGDEYKDYLYIDKDFKEVDKLVEALEKILDAE